MTVANFFLCPLRPHSTPPALKSLVRNWRSPGATGRKATSIWKSSGAPALAPRAAASPTFWDTCTALSSATVRTVSNSAASATSADTRCNRLGTMATARAFTLSANFARSTNMPPREFITPRDKREELKTYRELALRRDLKSKLQRKRVEADGRRRVIGDGSDTQPYLIVEARSEERRVGKECRSRWS